MKKAVLFHCCNAFVYNPELLNESKMIADLLVFSKFSSVQLSSVTQSCSNLDAIQTSHPLTAPLLLPPVFSSIRVFSNEPALRIRWPKYWIFSFSICSSNEHPGQIPFRLKWLDLLLVQGTLRNLLQHHSSKASIL